MPGARRWGDDGIAVAMIMAILDAKDLKHTPLGAVFTTDEECGYAGCVGVDVRSARPALLNLDGGRMCSPWLRRRRAGKLRPPCQPHPGGGLSVSVTVDGLAGGHSGVEIDKGGAIQTVSCAAARRAASGAAPPVTHPSRRFKRQRDSPDDGGLPGDRPPTRTGDRRAEAFGRLLKAEYAASDANVRVTLQKNGTYTGPALTRRIRRSHCSFNGIPKHVQEMSREIPGLVQTSLKLGVVTWRDGAARDVLCRSNMGSQKEMLKRRGNLNGPPGGSIHFSGDYPAGNIGATPLSGGSWRDSTGSNTEGSPGLLPCTAAWNAAFSPPSCRGSTASPWVPRCRTFTPPASA